MSNFNRVIIMGNLTKDPELRYTPSGDAIAELNLAINSKCGDKETVTFINKITVWKKQAENCSEYLTKGNKVLIEGHLKNESWEKEGQKFSALRVVADSVRFLGGNTERKNTAPKENEEDMPY